MKLIASTAAALVVTATLAVAQQGMPGAHFIENWDADGDGQVTLLEATERRGDIFASFDSDDNGQLDRSEYDQFDAARAADMEQNGGMQGHGRGQMQQIMQGLMHGFNDVNGDGAVSLDEFIAKTAEWHALMDRNADGIVATDDFGPKG